MMKNRFDEAICWLNEAIEYGEERHNAPYEEAIKALEEIQQYRAIGTVEEFKSLREKNEPKKIEKRGYVFVCPICKKWLQSSQENCHGCGQKLDWS